MAQPLGLISPAEASITRRTASVPLLRVLNDAQPATYWPGDAAAPMHTAIDFWQSAGGCVRASGGVFVCVGVVAGAASFQFSLC